MANDTAVGADRSAASNILKDFYLGPIRSQLNSQTILMKRLQKREDVFEGQQIVVPLHTGRNAGVMARGENTPLPVAGRQGYQRVTTTAKYIYGRIQISGPLLASARTNRGAFVSAIESEVRGVTRDMKKDLNRQMWGDGSGRLGAIQAVGSTTNFTVRSPWDWAGQSTRLKFFNIGDRINFEDVSAGAGVSQMTGVSKKITALSLTAQTITIDSAPATPVAVGDQIVKAYDTGVNASIADTTLRGMTAAQTPDTQKEMMGLVGIISGSYTNNWPRSAYSGAAYQHVGEVASINGQAYAGTAGGGANRADANLQGLSASTEPTWVANTDFNAGVPRPLTTDKLQQMVDVCEVLGESRPTILLGTHAVRRAYVNLLTADRRYVNEYMLDGGFKAIDFDGIPLVPEVDAPEGAIVGVCEPNLWIGRMSDFYFMDKDGAVFSRVPGYDQWEATLAYYAELCAERRNACFALGDIQI